MFFISLFLCYVKEEFLKLSFMELMCSLHLLWQITNQKRLEWFESLVCDMYKFDFDIKTPLNRVLLSFSLLNLLFDSFCAYIDYWTLR